MLNLKTALKIAGVILVSLMLGVGSAFWVMFSPPKVLQDQISVKNGNWRTSDSIASEDAGAYLRAIMALLGHIALDKSEAIYYVAQEDSDGNPLSSDYDYRVVGQGQLPSRWWSISLYGTYALFVPNEQKRYSYNDASLTYADDGSYIVHISPEEHSGNWLPSGEENRLFLTLRLYHPEQVVYDQLTEIELPRIERVN